MDKLFISFVAILLFAAIVAAAQPEHPGKGPIGKITFIHYKRNYAKPETECGNGICEPGENAKKCPADCGGGEETSTCYGFISKGLKWKTTENYEIDPDNSESISQNDVVSAVNAGINEWDSQVSFNIFGSDSVSHDCVFNEDTTDNHNCIMFGLLSNPNIIGVTNVWGYYTGPPASREIVEFDIVFNEYFTWGINYNPYEMDLQSIATHELGHAAGMDDLYTASCTEETMYGYAGEGETKKRTLNAGDITGINELY